jgi:hypothetical protein
MIRQAGYNEITVLVLWQFPINTDFISYYFRMPERTGSFLFLKHEMEISGITMWYHKKWILSVQPTAERWENMTDTDNKKVIKALERGTLHMLDDFYGITTMTDDTGADPQVNNDSLYNEDTITPAVQKPRVEHRYAYPSDCYAGVYGFIVAKNCVKRSPVKNAPEPFGMVKNSGN